MRNVILFVALLLGLNCYCQSDTLRKGNGNGTFIPDITQSTKLLVAKTSLKNFEKLLPSFAITDSSIQREYNKYTDKWDSITGIIYNYKFVHVKQYKVSVEVKTDLKGKITELTYWFDPFPTFFKRQQQLTANGYHFNEYSSKVGTKLNGSPLQYYDAANTCVVLDKYIEKFKIFRVEK